MKQLLITIAALVLVGCGPSVPDISFITACWHGNIEAVKQHLAAGTDVNAENGAPIRYAAEGGHKEIVELLIANGAALNAKDDRGETPLDWAVQVKEPEIAALFRKHGAKTGEELKAEGK